MCSRYAQRSRSTGFAAHCRGSRAVRFSRKLASPSRASCVARRRARRPSLPAPQAVPAPLPASISCLVSCTDTGASRQMSAAIARALRRVRRRRRPSRAPSRRAAPPPPPMRRPVSAIYFTRLAPIKPASRCVPGPARDRRDGQPPATRTCASRSATRMSAAAASSSPPPRACPLMAAITGTRRRAQLIEHLMAALDPASATCRAAPAPTTR